MRLPVVPWLVGLDLGQATDPTALVILQRHEVLFGSICEYHYAARYIERFPLGIKYPAIVAQVEAQLKALPVPWGWTQSIAALERGWTVGDNTQVSIARLPHYHLLIDATGVGRAVVDMFQEKVSWPIRVVITGGDAITVPERDTWHVPKKHLISPLQVVMQTRRLKLPAQLPESKILVQEAENFRLKKTAAGNDQYEAWREGQHDDILLACAMAVWYGERSKPAPLSTVGQAVADGVLTDRSR